MNFFCHEFGLKKEETHEALLAGHFDAGPYTFVGPDLFYPLPHFSGPHHIFIYLVGDIAFVPIEVLLVTLIIHRLLETREKKAMLDISEITSEICRRSVVGGQGESLMMELFHRKMVPGCFRLFIVDSTEKVLKKTVILWKN